MASATIVDVDLIRRMLARHRPMAEIVERTGATEEQIARVRRNFEIVPVKTPAGQMDWEPHKAELRRLYFEGKTSGWVAAHYGVTRNAIVGVWSRMDLPPRNKGPTRVRRRTPEEIQKRLETRRQQHAERQRAKRAEEAEKAARDPHVRRTQRVVLAAIHAGALSLPDLPTDPPTDEVVPILVHDENGKLVANEKLNNSTCRWFVGDPVDPKAGFCPSKAVNGLPYCEAHARRAFQPPQPRRPRTASRPPKTERISTFADAESD